MLTVSGSKKEMGGVTDGSAPFCVLGVGWLLGPEHKDGSERMWEVGV